MSNRHGSFLLFAASILATLVLAACSSSPAPDSRSQSASNAPAMRAFVDEAGNFTSPPPGKRPESKPSGDRFPTARELQRDRIPLPGGGYAYDVRGRLGTYTCAERGPDGKVRIVERAAPAAEGGVEP